MSRWKTGWKVTSKYKGKFASWSPIVDGELDEDEPVFSAMITYDAGKEIEPRDENGPLCIFKKFEHAKNFGSWRGDAVFPCVYLESDKLEIWDEFDTVALKDLPFGTVLADMVILHH